MSQSFIRNGIGPGSNHIGYVYTEYDNESSQIDSFGRLRISNPFTMFDAAAHYDKLPLVFEDFGITGGGQSTHLPNESSVELTTGDGTSGSKIYRQTRQFMPYQPGKSQLVFMTAVLGAKKAGVRQRIGYFDDKNGIFFEQTETYLRIVRRSNVTGTPSDSVYANQADWNIDTMDGTGGTSNPSGINLNTANVQIFVISFQWLGAGRVVVGLSIEGHIFYVHEFLAANVIPNVYMTSPHLPLRYEIENTGAASGATTMKCICCSVISEGGFETSRGYEGTTNNGITSIGVTTRRALVSIRPKATLNSIPVRTPIIPLEYSAITKTNDALFELVYNPTFTTGGGALTWTSVGNNSTVEYCVHGDANAGAFTNGYVVHSGYVIAGTGAERGETKDFVESYLNLTLDNAGANPIALSVVATSFTGTATMNASLCWKEIY